MLLLWFGLKLGWPLPRLAQTLLCLDKQLLFSYIIPKPTLSTFHKRGCVFKENPKSNLDLDFRFVKNQFWSSFVMNIL